MSGKVLTPADGRKIAKRAGRSDSDILAVCTTATEGVLDPISPEMFDEALKSYLERLKSGASKTLYILIEIKADPEKSDNG